eukprot:10299504-Alexandrium_andersonii.AAC.1
MSASLVGSEMCIRDSSNKIPKPSGDHVFSGFCRRPPFKGHTGGARTIPTNIRGTGANKIKPVFCSRLEKKWRRKLQSEALR